MGIFGHEMHRKKPMLLATDAGKDSWLTSLIAFLLGVGMSHIAHVGAKLSEPAKPTFPSEPAKPTLPSEPAKPTLPSEPAKPTLPSQPAKPTLPSEPAKPTLPSEPAKPTLPSEPAKPTLPSEPAKPTLPSQPAKPTLPSLPPKPTLPSLPPKPTAKPTLPSQPAKPTLPSQPAKPTVPSADKSVASLEALGVRVYGLDAPLLNSSNGDISWDNIAGYEQQKREIEDTILLTLHSPKVYDDIARGTRRKFESNRPRAVLFEGPPGTGKTSCARVIANQAGIPLLHIPLEVVISKWYGDGERLLGKVFSIANELPNGAIIFLDEVDSFAGARDGQMHEVTRRLLSMLLRQIDGFEQDKKVVVIGATNRKEDLDPAFISRFDTMIYFGLPDQQAREEIAAQYAKHLTKSESLELANTTEGMSGRDIRDLCQQAERRWASKIIRGKAPKDGERCSLPPLQEYIESAASRKKACLFRLCRST